MSADAKRIISPVSTQSRLVLVAFVLLPLFSFINVSDAYVSWALYSGNTQEADIRVSPDAYMLLPPEIQAAATGFDSYYSIKPSRYSYVINNTPAYPETRVYRSIAEYLCTLSSGQGVTLILYGKSHEPYQAPREFTCSELYKI